MKPFYNLFIIIFIILLSMLFLVTGSSPARTGSGPVKRIVSLSSSLTDQVNDLGAADLLVGVTMFNPGYRGNAAVVGSYVQPDMERIISLRPDIVLVSDEDSIQTSALADRFGLRYYRSGRVFNFDDICAGYLQLADLIGKDKYGKRMVESYRERLEVIKKPGHAPRIVFLVSAKPLITVSGNSYINSIIESAGGRNIFKNENTAYPILSMESLLMSSPDAVITMSIADRDFMRDMLKGYRHVRFSRNNNIFAAGDTSIPYYSPGRYVEAVEKISSLFAEINCEEMD
ncbi:MAG TPA: helical backbone metal receptor [Spirochaetota bacterium]|nr:helical backbone metal receptor [Spirochaetota bacterium]